jgi:hypothetical protein
MGEQETILQKMIAAMNRAKLYGNLKPRCSQKPVQRRNASLRRALVRSAEGEEETS